MSEEKPIAVVDEVAAPEAIAAVQKVVKETKNKEYKLPPVPHHDATPNHEKYLAEVMAAAEEKRARKLAKKKK